MYYVLLGHVSLEAQQPIVVKLSHGRSVGLSVRTYVHRLVGRSVGLSSALWKNGRLDPDAFGRLVLHTHQHTQYIT